MSPLEKKNLSCRRTSQLSFPLAKRTAWKTLAAESVPNIYILEGGVNGWLDVFHEDELGIEALKGPVVEDEMGYLFEAALGGCYEASDPHFNHYEGAIFFNKSSITSDVIEGNLFKSKLTFFYLNFMFKSHIIKKLSEC